MVVTGKGESGFDSAEGARNTSTTSKVGSRSANYHSRRGEVVKKNNDTGLILGTVIGESTL